MASRAENKSVAPAQTNTSISLEELEVNFDTGNYFLDEAEKDAHLDKGTSFFITAIEYDPDNQYGPRYILTVAPVGIEPPIRRGWSMSAHVQNRSLMLEKLAEAQEAAQGRPIGPIQFYRKGRTVLIRSVGAAEAAASDDLPF